MSADASGLRRKLDAYGDRLAAEAAAELLRTTDRAAPTDTRLMRDTGDIAPAGKRRWEIRYSADYASFTDRGNAEGGRAMVPVRAPYLVFRYRGRLIRTKRVRLSAPGWWSDNVNAEGWTAALVAAKQRIRRA